MSSFSVFLAPLTGIMMCDYFLLRRQVSNQQAYLPCLECTGSMI